MKRAHGVSAWLVNPYFVDDDPPRRTTLDQWRAALPRIKQRPG